jgi:hypothetical protein
MTDVPIRYLFALTDNSEEEANLSRFIFSGLRDERRRVLNKFGHPPKNPPPEMPQSCQEVHAQIVPQE